jgi:hypothetical protein
VTSISVVLNFKMACSASVRTARLGLACSESVHTAKLGLGYVTFLRRTYSFRLDVGIEAWNSELEFAGTNSTVWM